MAWSVKLQSGTGGTQGYNEWQAVYDAASQTALKLKYGFSLGNQAPDVLFHTPDNGAPIPVRANGANRLLFLTVDIPASATWDSITGLVNTLARLVDGPNSQAVRAQTAGDVDKVRVAIKPNGATYTTYFEVLTGFMDTSTAFTEPDAVLNVLGRNVTLALTCKPYGYGDSFTLSNQLASSPHFVEDSNADGLADGWTKTGTPTTSINTTQYLMGGKSQAISTSTQFHGIYSSSISLINGASGAGYVWLTVGTAGWVIQIYNVTDASVTVTKTITATDSNAVSDRSTKNSAGGTAWRVPLTWTNSTGGTKSYRIYIIAAASTSSNCIVHAAYLAQASAAPAGFGSTRSLYNRYDPGVATTNINYLDVWGIPGDAPALANLALTFAAGKATKYIAGAYHSGKDLVTAVTHYFDSSDFSDVSGTWTTGTGTINNHYYQCSTTSGTLRMASAGEGLQQQINNTYANQVWRVFALAYTSDVNATIQIKYNAYASGTLITQTNVGQLTDTSKWQLVDLGVLNLVGVLSEDISYDLSTDIEITQASSQTLRIDGIFYLPTQSGFNITQHYTLTESAYKNIVYSNKDNSVYDYARAIRLESLGDLPTLYPGVMNRILFLALDGADDELDITTTFVAELTVTPRTSHLLGVG